MEKLRCGWCDLNSPQYIRYHDEQWGVPVRDDRLLYEMLVLEGMQAGLSWLSILKKRDNFLRAFENFEIGTVAAYGEEKVAELMVDAGIVRNRLKITSAISNAQVVLELIEEFGSFANYLWGWVENRPIQNSCRNQRDMPPPTPRHAGPDPAFKSNFQGLEKAGNALCRTGYHLLADAGGGHGQRP